jgi:hypothetical protein
MVEVSELRRIDVSEVAVACHIMEVDSSLVPPFAKGGKSRAAMLSQIVPAESHVVVLGSSCEVQQSLTWRQLSSMLLG